MSSLFRVDARSFHSAPRPSPAGANVVWPDAPRERSCEFPLTLAYGVYALTVIQSCSSVQSSLAHLRLCPRLTRSPHLIARLQHNVNPRRCLQASLRTLQPLAQMYSLP